MPTPPWSSLRARRSVTSPAISAEPPVFRPSRLAIARPRRYMGTMSRAKRSDDWGFPRWRPYGSSTEAQKVRLCDRHGCTNPGNCPAPKSPNSPDRWYFCETHAAEYNRGWDYFEGLSAEDAAERADRKSTRLNSSHMSI